ncbi:MAG: hypothetical protein SFU86_08090 [Pirellulaceae bacterium]|nr:hypothetical protein [Pirellulaceae bacterium]
MAQHHRPKNNRLPPRGPADNRTLRRLPERSEVAPPAVYGEPFLVLEDSAQNTFIYEGGKWVPHDATIAEYRRTSLVKEFPQRVKGRIRYEIRSPLA